MVRSSMLIFDLDISTLKDFHFECVEGDGFPPLNNLAEPVGPEWTGFENGDKWIYLNSREDGFETCQDACGQMRTKVRNKVCSVEDLCVGEAVETKMCGGSAKPDECPQQVGECDADGFRAIYWQHIDNEAFSFKFKARMLTLRNLK